MSTQPYKFILPLLITSFLTACGIDTIGYGGGDNTSDAVPDTTAPTVPSNLVAENVSVSKINLSWMQSTDNLRVYRYQIYRDGLEHSIVNHSNSISTYETEDGSAEPNTRHCYTVTARDRASNESGHSNRVCATTPEDVTAPTALANVNAVSVSTQRPEIDISWESAQDDHRVAGYMIFRNGVPIQDVFGTSFTDSTLNSNTQYCYTVIAYDVTLNESEHSNKACTTSSWATRVVDDTVDSELVSLALDPFDNVHIGYTDFRYIPIFDNNNNHTGTYKFTDIKYATNSGGTWTTQVIVDVEIFCCPKVPAPIAIDQSGSVHIAFFNKYAIKLSDGWVTEEVFNLEPNPSFISSIALDSAGNAHISYSQCCAVHATNSSGVWTTEVVSASPAFYTVLTVDSSNTIHIAYYDFLAEELRYVSNSTGFWTTEIVEGTSNVWDISITSDADGKAHLSYYDKTNRDLRYATNASGAWITQTLDSQGDVGQATGIVMDETGYAHISYTDLTNQYLKYITNASGIWNTMIIDSSSIVAGSGTINNYTSSGTTSIATDSLGKVHIAYRADKNLSYVSNR